MLPGASGAGTGPRGGGASSRSMGRGRGESINETIRTQIIIFLTLYENLLLFETNILFFSIIKIQLYFAFEETYVLV